MSSDEDYETLDESLAKRYIQKLNLISHFHRNRAISYTFDSVYNDLHMNNCKTYITIHSLNYLNHEITEKHLIKILLNCICENEIDR